MKITVNKSQYKKLVKEFRELEAKDFLNYEIKIVQSEYMPEDMILIDNKLIYLRKGLNKTIRIN